MYLQSLALAGLPLCKKPGLASPAALYLQSVYLNQI